MTMVVDLERTRVTREKHEAGVARLDEYFAYERDTKGRSMVVRMHSARRRQHLRSVWRGTQPKLGKS